MEQWITDKIEGPVREDVRDAYTQIRAQMPNAAVYILGYPHLFPDTPAEQSCSKLRLFSHGEQDMMNRMSDLLTDTLADVAAEIGVHYVDVRAAFDEHQPCSSEGEDHDEWINAVTNVQWKPSTQFPFVKGKAGNATFHPNYLGQVGYANALRSFIDAQLLAGALINLAGLPWNPSPQGFAAASAAPLTLSSTDATVNELEVVFSAAPACSGATAANLQPGQTVEVRGEGFGSGASVTMTLYDEAGQTTVGTLTAATDGTFATNIVIPLSASLGSALIEATGDGSVGEPHVSLIGMSIDAVIAPCVEDDIASTPADTAVTIAVPANDTHPAGPLDPASVAITQDATFGTTVVAPSTGAVTYTPDSGFRGTDIFAYSACRSGVCDDAVVTVTVNAACTILGTEGDDVLTGTAGDDVICGGGGHDEIGGGDGNDIIYGDGGDDTLFGDGGSDRIIGGDGNDMIHGGGGVDTIDGGMGDNSIYDNNDSTAPTIAVTTPPANQQYEQGDVVTVAFACNEETGGSGLQTCTGSTSNGQPLDTATIGPHTLTVSTKDWAGNIRTVNVPYQVVPRAPRVLLVVGNPSSLTAADTALKNRLQGGTIGAVVTTRDDSAAENIVGQNLVVIAESVNASQVGTKYVTVGVPVVVLQQGLWDEQHLITGNSSNTNLTGVYIENAASPISTGLTNPLTHVTSSASTAYANDSQLGSGATQAVAQSSSNLTRNVAFHYNTGATLAGGTASPARRVALGYREAVVTKLTANGWTVFDNAIHWALGIP